MPLASLTARFRYPRTHPQRLQHGASHQRSGHSLLRFPGRRLRTPEFQAKAASIRLKLSLNQSATATGEASYFFGGPVKNADVHWAVLSSPYTFSYDDGQYWSFTDIEPGYNPWPWSGGFGGYDPRFAPAPPKVRA